MDFLDPKKQRAYKLRLVFGYILVGIALVLTTTVLLYQAYGFGIDKNGQIIQSGLVFVSSTPNPARIFVNGNRYKDDTNVRLPLPAGQYVFELQRDNYHTWKRAVTVEGGSVEHFDYPFLFPAKLQTSTVKGYANKPRLVTQSPDRRWLAVQANEAINRFEMYDLKNQKDPLKDLKEVMLPDGVVTASQSEGASSWELVQWSTDNRHVVLKHHFQKNSQPAYEYVLMDREDPAQSVNLTSAWGVNPTDVELRDQNYDEYYLFDKAAGTVSTASVKQPAPKPYLDGVLDFKSYGDNVMLYATDKDAGNGKAIIKLRDGDKTHTIRTVTTDAKYLLNLTKYDGDWYVVAGASGEGKAYVYKNPVDMLKSQKITVPVHILKVANANYIEFSDNARFVMIEGGQNFALYDAENEKGYAYTAKQPVDAPQTHATWMDGHRLTYTTNGKVVVFDFDGANERVLNTNDAFALPAFDRDYEYLYTFAPSTNTEQPFSLNKTPMRTEEDL